MVLTGLGQFFIRAKKIVRVRNAGFCCDNCYYLITSCVLTIGQCSTSKIVLPLVLKQYVFDFKEAIYLLNNFI